MVERQTDRDRETEGGARLCETKRYETDTLLERPGEMQRQREERRAHHSQAHTRSQLSEDRKLSQASGPVQGIRVQRG